MSYKRSLYSVILSALIYDVDLTLQVLDSDSYLESFLDSLFDSEFIYRSHYERKLFIFGLSHILFKRGSAAPNPSRLKLPKVFKEVIEMLVRQ